MAHDVYISYSSKDKPTADAVCQGLEAAGVRVWIAPRDVPGVTWSESILEAIATTRLMVVIFSANANHSPQVVREVERAVSKGVPVILFRVEDVEPSRALEYHLGSLGWHSLSTSYWLDAIEPPLERHVAALGGIVRSALVTATTDLRQAVAMAEKRVSAAPAAVTHPSPDRPATGEQRPAEGGRAPTASSHLPHTGGKYDVFISYRRQLGAEAARAIHAALSGRGWKVFLDVDDLDSGYFDEALLEHIAHSPNFLIVLAPESLDRCDDPQDWLRREVVQAVDTKRHIVPVLMPGFTFPHGATLPDQVQRLRRHQSVEYSHIYFRAMMERLIGYLTK